MLKHATFIGAFALSLAGSGAIAQEATADTVIATVNGTEITLGQMIITRAQLPQQYAQLPDDVLFGGVLDQLIQQQLLADSLETTPARVTYAVQNEERSLKAGEVINNITLGAVDEDALNAAYDARYADALPSTGPTGPNGGNLGWFGTGQMVPAFEEAVAAMSVGDISDPVQTQFGWHVINLIETRNAQAPSFDEVRQDLFGQVQEAAIQARLTDLTDAATVVMPEDGEFDPTLISNIDLLDN